MSIVGAVFTVILAVAITYIITAAIYGREVQCLDQENRMLRRLLSEQAKLHQMSLDAYVAMLREAQRHIGG